MPPLKKKLLHLFDDLEETQQEILLAFTEFLHARAIQARAIPTTPLSVPRPATENVISAIKRLSATYPMLNQGHLFNATSLLMSSHIMEGRPAVEVIDELEILFKNHFEQWTNEQRLLRSY